MALLQCKMAWYGLSCTFSKVPVIHSWYVLLEIEAEKM